jgi:hypothetical protein
VRRRERRESGRGLDLRCRGGRAGHGGRRDRGPSLGTGRGALGLGGMSAIAPRALGRRARLAALGRGAPPAPFAAGDPWAFVRRPMGCGARRPALPGSGGAAGAAALVPHVPALALPLTLGRAASGSPLAAGPRCAAATLPLLAPAPVIGTACALPSVPPWLPLPPLRRTLARESRTAGFRLAPRRPGGAVLRTAALAPRLAAPVPFAPLASRARAEPATRRAAWLASASATVRRAASRAACVPSPPLLGPAPWWSLPAATRRLAFPWHGVSCAQRPQSRA